VVEVVEDLERTGKVKDVDFTGTTWRLAFSTSTTESAGKLGPFTGRVRQRRGPGLHFAQCATASTVRPQLLYTKRHRTGCTAMLQP